MDAITEYARVTTKDTVSVVLCVWIFSKEDEVLHFMVGPSAAPKEVHSESDMSTTTTH